MSVSTGALWVLEGGMVEGHLCPCWHAHRVVKCDKSVF